MNTDDTETGILASIDALNDAINPMGIRFEYEPETMGLVLLTNPDVDPDWQGAVNQIVILVTTMVSCAFEITAHTTREQALSKRHAELHRVFMSLGDALGAAFEGSRNDMSGDIEIAGSVPTKH